MRIALPVAATTFCLLILGATPLAIAENWPSWRGPHGTGVSGEANLPTKFGKTDHVAWRLPLPGPAGSTPVVWDNQIFLTTVDSSGNLLAMGVGTDGKEQWRVLHATGSQTVRGDEGNFASPSPVTDGQHVWIFTGEGTLACLTVQGQEVWKFNAQDRFGKFDIAFGLSSTPVLDGDTLYLQLIHGDGDIKTREACVVAIDALTGKTRWKVDRASDGHSENEHSYASPVMYDDGQQKFLLTHGCDYVVAHRLSDGSELWRSGGLNLKNKYDPTLRFVASPAVAPGLIIVPSAKAGPVLALKPGFTGDITNTAEARLWTANRTPDVPSPLVHDGLVYLCMEDGNLNVLEAQTGKSLYFERTHRMRHRASPVYADGKLYLSARDGRVTVVKAGPKFEILAENEFEEDLSASPAISNGKIYFRTFEALYAIE